MDQQQQQQPQLPPPQPQNVDGLSIINENQQAGHHQHPQNVQEPASSVQQNRATLRERKPLADITFSNRINKN